MCVTTALWVTTCECVQPYIGLTGAAIARHNAVPEAVRNLAHVYNLQYVAPVPGRHLCGVRPRALRVVIQGAGEHNT